MILVVTFNPAVDWNVHVDGGQPRAVLRSWRSAGGKGLNVNRVLGRLGTPNRAFAPLGGATGREIFQSCSSAHIRLESFPIESSSRVNITIAGPHDTSERSNQLGPNLGTHELRRMRRALGRAFRHASIVVFSGSIPPGIPIRFLIDAVKMASRMRKRTVVDTSGAALAAVKKIPVWLLKPNDEEWNSIGRRAPKAEWLLISRGPKGAELRHAGKIWKATAATLRDGCTVGAGDSLLAGFLHEFLRRRDPAGALKFAVRCGAACASNDAGKLADVKTLRKIRGRVRLSSSRRAA